MAYGRWYNLASKRLVRAHILAEPNNEIFVGSTGAPSLLRSVLCFLSVVYRDATQNSCFRIKRCFKLIVIHFAKALNLVIRYRRPFSSNSALRPSNSSSEYTNSLSWPMTRRASAVACIDMAVFQHGQHVVIDQCENQTADVAAVHVGISQQDQAVVTASCKIEIWP